MTALEKRAKEASEGMRLRYYDKTADAIDELLSAHAKANRELAACKKALRIERDRDYEGLSDTTYKLLERKNVTL